MMKQIENNVEAAAQLPEPKGVPIALSKSYVYPIDWKRLIWDLAWRGISAAAIAKMGGPHISPYQIHRVRATGNEPTWSVALAIIAAHRKFCEVAKTGAK